MSAHISKEEVAAQAHAFGAVLVGFAPVGRWAEHKDLDKAFYPQNIWPHTQTVIAMGVPSLLPTTESKVSHLYQAQYLNTNSLLDEAAYRLAAYLNRNGYASLNICRDGYGSHQVLRNDPTAIFSHVWAGHYAGLGLVGLNHMLITPQFGPRLRLVSVLTELELEGDPMIQKKMCSGCRLCEKACPTHSFTSKPGEAYSDMNKISCLTRRVNPGLMHCGYCSKVCPIGLDRRLYQDLNVRQYFDEQKDFNSWQAGIGAHLPGVSATVSDRDLTNSWQEEG